MFVAPRLRLAFALALGGPLCAAAPPPAAVHASAAVVDGVSFSTDQNRLTVRVRTSERPRSVSVDRQGRTVQLVLVGARLSPSPSRGRAEAPVRDYRLEASGDRVTVTLDAPGSETPRATIDERTSDVLLTFGGAPDVREAPRRMVAWGGVVVPRAEPVANPEPRTAPRRRTRRAPAPATASSTPARPVPPAAQPSSPVQSPAPSTWATAPQVVVPMTPEASATYAGTGANWRLDTIVLDAGHGGHDVGATYNGVREKDVTLGIVRHLGRMIEQELGVRVVYTRTDDHFEELRERGRIANRAGGKLFVSIHANAAASSSASGTETYFLAPHRSANAQEVMDRENAVIQLESAPALYAEFTDQGDILQALAMSAYQEESQDLARLVEGAFAGQSRRSRGVKQAGFLVLWAASMPAILVETGFVSNPDEARILGSAAGQERTARAVFEAIRAYRDHYEQGLRLATR